ncbi:hypothetical protein M9Y10_021825 [Tritrichomonas musculus]|uniref:EF-hand domain-containing protein n=1 Tax=Tritrichomonas musculus TaxID=1915356 RepID=A0ABR2KTT7_9EUKA
MDTFRSNKSFFASDSSSEYDNISENQSHYISENQSVTFSAIQSPSLTARVWDVPPKSMNSRIGRLEKNRETSHKKKFLRELRQAFEKSDINNNKTLTFEAWCCSEIKNVIHDGRLSQFDYENYFKRIDVNCDGLITWNELVTYLMNDIKLLGLKPESDAAQFIKKLSSPPKNKSQCHRELIQQITICNRLSEYVTVSSDSIRFWNISDLTFSRALLEPGMFSRILVIESFLVLAVTTTNRRLLFFDLESLTQFPVEVGASPSPKQIKSMSQSDAKGILKIIKSPTMPLYNVPTVLIMAQDIYSDPKYEHFWVGDDQGSLELYKLSAPTRRKGLDYKIERIARFSMHKSGITQITYIYDYDCYATSSLDHTVKFWTYSFKTKKFSVTRTFTDKNSILGFHFSFKQKALTTCGISRDAYVWSISPPNKLFKLGGHYNQLSHISDFVATTGKNYIITMTCKKEFRVWDASNYTMVREWMDPVMLRPENHYSSVMYDDKRHALLTAANFPVKWAEDISALNESLEPMTHGHTIVGCKYTKEFNEIVTIDRLCTIKVWNIEMGQNASSHVEPWSDSSSDICAVTIDPSGRRLITSSFKNQTLMWNYNSGSVINSINLQPESPLITILEFFEINFRSYLVRAGWDKTLCIYQESEFETFDLVRKYTGHVSDISAVSAFSQGLISGSVSGELFEWSVDTTFPVASIQLEPAATVEAIECYGNFAIIGDSNGILTVVSLPKLKVVQSLEAHKIIVQHSITAIAASVDDEVIFTADTLGYVKRWNCKVSDTDQTALILSESFIERCHNSEIRSLVLCYNNEFLATCGADQCVRLWKKDTFEYVGFFSESSKWNLHDPETWIKKPPFEKEEVHFYRKSENDKLRESLLINNDSNENFELKGVYTKTNRTEFDMNNENNNNNSVTDSADQKNEQSDLFNPEMIRKALDEYTDETDSAIRKKQDDIMEAIRANDHAIEPLKKPKLLQMSQRPNELIRNITKILNKNNPSRTAAAPVLKIPMIPPKRSKSGIKKGKKSTELYAPTLFD